MIVTRIFAADDGSARIERLEQRQFIPVGPAFDITRWPLA
jgi:hypothetical protein